MKGDARIYGLALAAIALAAACTVDTTGGPIEGGIVGIGPGDDSSGGDGGSACPPFTSSDACGACELENCCPEYTTCGADPACAPCIDAPTTACEQNQNFVAASSCVTAHCAAPCAADGGAASSSGSSSGSAGTAKLGDKCSADAACASGLCAMGSTGGLWCTEVCTSSQGCGASSAGVANTCVASGASNVCFPTCTGAAQCQVFGTVSCVAADNLEGTVVMVCGTTCQVDGALGCPSGTGYNCTGTDTPVTDGLSTSCTAPVTDANGGMDYCCT